MPNPTCTVSGCEKPARSATASLCPKHYHRKYRHGDVAADMRKIKTSTPRTYRTVSAKGHPVAGKNGRAYEHRVKLYDEIGPGPHACLWCGSRVEWGLPKGHHGALTVDHLDGDKGNNRAENLAPSCGRCNAARAASDRRVALSEAGAWSGNDTVARLRDPAQRRHEPFPIEFLASTIRSASA